MIADTLVFAIVVVVLSASHYVLNKSHLPPERTLILEKIHYYAYLVFIVIIFGGFVLKVLAFEYNGFQRLKSSGK